MITVNTTIFYYLIIKMYTDAKIQQSQEAKSKAWADFKMKYPNADLSRFEAQVYFDASAAVASDTSDTDKDKTSSEIVFKHSNGVETSVSGSNRRYWSNQMREALGIGRFPIELTLRSTDFSYPGTSASSNKFSDEGGSAQKGNLYLFHKPTERISK